MPQPCNLDGISMNIQEENSAHYFRVQSECEQTSQQGGCGIMIVLYSAGCSQEGDVGPRCSLHAVATPLLLLCVHV